MAKHSELFGSCGMCPHKRGVCNSGGWIRGVPLYICMHMRTCVYTCM